MSAVKSVILSCAGIGSRLGMGQTKALLNINGRSLISYHLEYFRDVEDLRIVIGYQAREVVKEVLKYRQDVVFVYNHDYFDTKTGASFYLGSKHANEFVIEWDGDLIVHPEDVERILSMDGEFICYSDITSEEAVFVNTNEKGEVISFSTKHGDYEWTGPVCVRKEKVFNTKGNVFEQINPILPLPGLKIQAFDIDTFDDYKRVSMFIRNW